MRELPERVRQRLADPVHRRADAGCVARVAQDLGVTPHETFVAFYSAFEGPFSSSSTGFEMFDLCDLSGGVKPATELCRRQYSFPDELLVLTDLLGGEVLVYDSASDAVMRVDFEGGVEELLSGSLEPDWKSFYEFLDQYFS